MRIPYRYRPGAGFVLLVVVTALVSAFLAWGLGEPDLDRFWFLKQMAEQHAIELDDEELAFLDGMIRTHGVMAEDVLDDTGAQLIEPTVEGWTPERLTHLVVAPVGEGREIEVECRGAALHPVTVTFTAPRLEKTLSFEDDGTLGFTIEPGMATAGPDEPFIVRVEVDGEFDPEADTLAGIRIESEGD
jgi:hypothetical protein